jgi:hypothetical protein
MLEGLDDVGWETLHHAYGPATDVPQLLRAIASDNAAVRSDAWPSLLRIEVLSTSLKSVR